MKRIHITEAETGNKLGLHIYGHTGKVLLAKGTRLTGPYISSLRKKGVEYIFIETRSTHGINPKPLISPTVRQQAVKKVYETMTSFLDKKSLLQTSSSQDLGKEYQKVFKEILDHLLANDNIMVNLSDLVLAQGHFFHHSVNVATLAGVIGIAKGYNSEQLLDLGVGALLFDIGMTQVPSRLWEKQGFMTKEERNIMNSHTVLGFELLRKQRNISLLSAHCALQHHERFDGSGYPRQLKGTNIHEYARIVAIADVYAALTSSRNYRKRHSPQEAAEFLSAAGNILFDHSIIKDFLAYIAIFPVSSRVVLNTGYEAVVAKNYSDLPLRPVVRVIKDPKGDELKSPHELDLRKEINITIVKAV
ncbi:HD domain-containing protein [Peribacillus saganii]|uniref:HD domain-containing protein n=1 Tax=Peribacillus saganii TaxID=2303992 RepID=A0A372LNS5_9BACI|nr:HD domain-containing phosphohydrolase [Peribacillus saganii]RFU69344.1 HD domain-containing protein [Peribacillus saganii]